VCCLALAVTGAGVRGSAPEDAYQYRVLSVANTAPGQKPVVTFEVINPINGNVRYDIQSDPPFTATANGASRLFVQFAWDTRDYDNTGSGSEKSGAAPAPALPIGVNALTTAQKNADLSFTVSSSRPLPLTAKGTGTVVIEGHPAEDVNGDGVLDRLPVKSAYQHFTITDAAVVPRRAVVDIEKCRQCHQPHLSLHGNNRTDEIQVCVTCHNPNATDIAYRTSGPETPIDFKRMVHAIHAGKMRKTPFVVIGFGGSVNDFSGVRFPRNLAECATCHVSGKYGLPLRAGTLATTVSTGSVYGPPKVVDGDPANDRNITPIASVCSSCHDDSEARRHMIQTGRASFSALQADIDAGRVRERCVRCHGPGKDKDVLKVHEHESEHESEREGEREGDH
jgi:OmcA/MtrC family decaheme c-type cytochrome